jgi:hypothetical protein
MDIRSLAFERKNSLKYEDVYLKAYKTVAEAKVGIGAWFSFYNSASQHPSVMSLKRIDYADRDVVPWGSWHWFWRA